MLLKLASILPSCVMYNQGVTENSNFHVLNNKLAALAYPNLPSLEDFKIATCIN